MSLISFPKGTPTHTGQGLQASRVETVGAHLLTGREIPNFGKFPDDEKSVRG